MNTRLNLSKIELAMEKLGLNRANLAKNLDVSRTIVTSWFQEEKFPRPDKLLKLGLALQLPFEKLVIKDHQEPVIAFRKKGPKKTKIEHIDRAKDMGRMLEGLVPWLPTPIPTAQPVLKKPTLNYSYIQNVVSIVRKQIGIKEGKRITYDHLIKKFHEFEIMIIPVLWGSKDNHENALHIRLPQSSTIWVYLNLDSKILDFNFWMAHEYGHILSPSLQLDEGEDFADMFAQSFLFPENSAQKAYNTLKSLNRIRLKVNHTFDIAKKLMISPVTIKKAVDAYSKENDLAPINFGKSFYGANQNFSKGHQTVSEFIFKGKERNASEYVRTARDKFDSAFFEVLKRYLIETGQSTGFIQNLLQTTLVDAKEVHAELVG